MRPATQAERMKAAGRLQVLLWLSAEAKQRLERLAVAHDLTQVSVVEAALLAFEAVPHEQRPAGCETSAQIDMALRSVIGRVDALEKALAALTVEAAPVYQSNMEAPEIGSCAAVEPLAEAGTLEAAETVDGGMVESEETDGMENEAVPSPPPILPNQPLTVKGLIDEMVAGGERSPTRIANALNDAGFRTQTKTRFERSNPQIKKALDAVRGK